MLPKLQQKYTRNERKLVTPDGIEGLLTDYGTFATYIISQIFINQVFCELYILKYTKVLNI